MNTTTKAVQWKQQHTHQEQIIYETVSQRRSCSTCKNAMEHNRDPDGYKKAIDGRTLRLSREDIADNLQTTNGADNLFMHHRNNPEQKATKEFYDTACGIDNSFIQKSRHPTQTSIDVAVPTSVARQPEFGRRTYDLYGNMEFYWEEKDEYGV
ncbi:hypothetical protein DY000_02047829 [Brassica cretica]|uniref:Uncharacterized protein n=1 Tax=Brassica cretica TaxID=69181 RepID=A0ABQ7EPS8_BRACR|nr:hypothetical protein DY000_02047829 [Brassica cretica]